MAALSAAIWPETWVAAPAALPGPGVEVTAHAMVIPVTPAVAAAATVEETTLRRLRPGLRSVSLVIGSPSIRLGRRRGRPRWGRRRRGRLRWDRRLRWGRRLGRGHRTRCRWRCRRFAGWSTVPTPGRRSGWSGGRRRTSDRSRSGSRWPGGGSRARRRRRGHRRPNLRVAGTRADPSSQHGVELVLSGGEPHDARVQLLLLCGCGSDSGPRVGRVGWRGTSRTGGQAPCGDRRDYDSLHIQQHAP